MEMASFQPPTLIYIHVLHVCVHIIIILGIQDTSLMDIGSSSNQSNSISCSVEGT